MSRQHARIELDHGGQYSLVDMKTTNGSFLNGARVDREPLHHGDEIRLGLTRFTFEQIQEDGDRPRQNAPRPTSQHTRPDSSPQAPSSSPRSRPLQMRAARLIWIEGGKDKDDYLLASETLIGRGVTNDIVLPDSSVATRHARILHDGSGYQLESLRSDAAPTLLNQLPLLPGYPSPLKQGDRIQLGNVLLRFEVGDD